MRHCLTIFVLVLFVAGCSPAPFIPPTPPPVPPGPPEPPPEPPLVQTWPRSTFDDVKPGEALSESLPPPERIVRTDGEKEIWVWVLDEKRPDGGQVRWEVHIVEGLVTYSGAF